MQVLGGSGHRRRYESNDKQLELEKVKRYVNYLPIYIIGAALHERYGPRDFGRTSRH